MEEEEEWNIKNKRGGRVCTANREEFGRNKKLGLSKNLGEYNDLY